MKKLARILVLAPILVALSASTAGCAWFKTAEAPLSDLGACILARAGADGSATPAMAPLAIVADVVKFCQTDEQTVLGTLKKLKVAASMTDAGAP